MTMPSHQGRKWTQEEMIQAGLVFTRKHDRYPTWLDHAREHNIPANHTVQRYFGTYRDYWAVLRHAGARPRLRAGTHPEAPSVRS
jgi:hypothetical protein